MTIDDKLQHFMEVSMKNAMTQKSSLVDDYIAGLNIQFENHKADADKKNEIQEKTAMDSIRREFSKDFAKEQQHIRRKLTHKKDELKEKLFAEVKEMLDKFFASDAYIKLLVDEINSSFTLAEDDDITIYIDPLDLSKKELLEERTGMSLLVNEVSFGRGMRATIPSKNILIDNSFDAKIRDIFDGYTINI